MIILDTNVLSALMRPQLEPEAVVWMDVQPRSSIWITAVSVLEIRFDLHILPASRRKSFLVQAFDAILERLDNRVLPFDDVAAQRAAELMSIRRKKGIVGEFRDTMIAGIVLAHHGTLATRNLKHFEDLPQVVNPWVNS